MPVQLSFEKDSQKGVILSSEDVRRETLPDTLLRPEVPVSPAVSTATSISPLSRLPSVGGGETGFKSIVLGPEAETPRRSFVDDEIAFAKRALTPKRPSDVREGLNQLIDQALGVPEGDELRAGEILPQFLRTGGRLASFGATLGPEIAERAVETGEAPPSQEEFLGFNLGQTPSTPDKFLRQEIQGIAEMVVNAIETGLSVADIPLEAAGLKTKRAKDVRLRRELLQRPEETVLGLSVAAAPFRGRPKPKGLEKVVSEAPKPDVSKVKLDKGVENARQTDKGVGLGKKRTERTSKSTPQVETPRNQIVDVKSGITADIPSSKKPLRLASAKKQVSPVVPPDLIADINLAKEARAVSKAINTKGARVRLPDGTTGEIIRTAKPFQRKRQGLEFTEHMVLVRHEFKGKIVERFYSTDRLRSATPVEQVPLFPKSPEPTTVRQATKDIPVLSNKRIAEALRSQGFEQLKPEARKGLIKSTEEAIANKQDVNASAIAAEALKSRRPLSASEQVGISLRFNEIEPQFKEASESAKKLRREGKDSAADLAIERASVLREEMLTLTEAARFSGGTEVGRALQIRGRLIDENVATVLLDAAKAKGSRLTPTETKKLETAVSAKETIEQQLTEMTKKFEAEVAKNEALTAEQIVKKSNREFSERRAKTRKEKILAKRESLKKDIQALGFRLNDITGVSAEGAFKVGQLAITYMEEARISLTQVVQKVRRDFPELTTDDVIQSINTKDPRRQRKAQSDAQRQVRELKTQARLLDDIRKAEEGVFAPGKTRIARSIEIKKLQKTLTELRKQAFKGVTEGARLERALQTIDRLQDQLANQFRDVRKKRPTDPAELVSARKDIASLRSDMRTVDALADVQEQLRTGDFKVREVVEREVPIEIQREQVKLKRARRQIRDIQESVAPVTPKKLSLEALNLARTIKATADMSATLRQGLVPTVHLLRKGKFGRLAKIQGQSIKSFFSEFTADQIDVAIRGADQHFIREQSGLFLAERGAPRLNVREESFMSKFAERIPGFGRIIKASDRHMATSLNLLRTSMFDMFREKFPNATRAELTAWADYVNAASGRGSFGQATNALSLIFFAPRFAASRFQTPFKLVKNIRNPRVRNEIAKDMASVLTMGTAALYIADLAGAEVGLDPRESDWGKIVLPSVKGKAKTRIDIWAGFQQPARLITRTILSATDRGGDIPAGEIPDPTELVGRFVRFKAAPPINILEALTTGETVVGEPVTPTDVALKAIQPIILESTIEAFQREGFGAAALTAGLEFGGVSVSTFEDSKSRVRRDIRKLLKDGNRKEALEKAKNWNLLNDQKIKSITVIKDGKATKVRVAP